jgi:V/A-type H+-transporting ATPase subunit I
MIAKMDRIEIVCIREALADIVNFLQLEGLVHIEEVPLAVADAAPDFLHRVQLDADQEREAEALENLYRSLSEVVPLLAVKPSQAAKNAAARELNGNTEEQLADMSRTWIRTLRSYTRRRINVQDNIEILSSFKKSLDTLRPLLEGRNVVLGHDARAFVLKGDGARVIERLSERLREQIGPESKLVHEKISRNVIVGAITYPPAHNEAVSKILKDEQITPMDPPANGLAGGSLGDVIRKVEAAIDRNKADAAKLLEETRAYSAQVGPKLMAVEAKFADRMAQITAINGFAQSEMIGVIHGWSPSDGSDAFIERLAKAYPGQTLVSKLSLREVDIHEVPTQLRNPAWLKPFEVLLTLFKPPTYGSTDPTALVAVSFVFFYGFILGDVAYGIAVAAFGYFLKRKFGHIPAVDAVGTVAYWMGGSTIFFGLLYGELFGNFGAKLGMPVFWFHRGHEPITLMKYAILFGVIHIPLALILGIRADLHHHHTKHAAEKFALLLGLIGTGIFVMAFIGVGLFTTMFAKAIGVLCFVAMFGLLVWAVGAMAPIMALEVVSLIGNVLSYCRLMALGLAGVLVADLANELAGGLGLLIGVPLALAVHAFNIGLGMFSPTIHSLRLNYVEFLPKFYKPEGKGYKPFKKEALW